MFSIYKRIQINLFEFGAGETYKWVGVLSNSMASTVLNPILDWIHKYTQGRPTEGTNMVLFTEG